MRDLCAARLSGAPHVLHSSLSSFPPSFESVGNPLENLVDLGNHFVVPEPQNPVAGVADKLGPALVLVRLISVLRSIDLDYEFGLLTKEVRKKRPDWILPTELESLEL